MATLPQQFLLGKKLFVSRKDHAARVLGQALSTPSGPQEMGGAVGATLGAVLGGSQDGSVLRDAFRQIEDYENKRNGVLTYDQSGTQVRVVLGQLPDGSFGFALLDNNNNVILQIGSPGGRTGMAIRNAAGVEQVFLGQVSTSPSYYGMQVRNSAGVEQLVAGTVQGQANATQNTSSGTPVTFGDGPTVNATLGPAGAALVSVGAFIGTTNTNLTGTAQCTVDGVAAGPLVQVSAGSSSIAASASCIQLVSGLTAGSHTFSHQYTASGVSVNFSGRTIVVIPL